MTNKPSLQLGPPNADTQPALEVIGSRIIHKNFARVEAFTLRSRNFDGSMTPAYEREIVTMGSGQASVVLPYDATQDAVILIEQLRVPAFVSQRNNGWCLEAVAGLIDAGEDAEAAARREAIEECNHQIGRLKKVGHYMPSPGGLTEIIHLFIGEVKAGPTGQIAGLASEHENIRVHVLPFAEALALADADRIENANCLLALNWLARHHHQIREEWTHEAA